MFISSSSSFIIKTKKKFGAKEGDLISLLNIYKVFYHLNKEIRKKFCSDFSLSYKTLSNIQKLVEHLTGMVTGIGLSSKLSSEDDIENILRCIVKAFYMNAVKRNNDGTYSPIAVMNQNSSNLVFHLDPSSIMNIHYPTYLIYFQLSRNPDNGKFYIKYVTEFFPEWLIELVPDYFIDKSLHDANKNRQEELMRNEKFELPIQMKGRFIYIFIYFRKSKISISKKKTIFI